MIFPFLGRILMRFAVPRRFSAAAFKLCWENGYAWGWAECSLCWLALILVVLILVLAIRWHSR